MLPFKISSLHNQEAVHTGFIMLCQRHQRRLAYEVYLDCCNRFNIKITHCQIQTSGKIVSRIEKKPSYETNKATPVRVHYSTTTITYNFINITVKGH